MREPTSSARTPSSLWLRLALAKLALGSAAFHTIDSNEDLMIGVAWSPLSSDALFAGGGRSGNTINPMVGSGLLVTRDNGSHWALETPGDGAYANPFPMAIVVASNKESESGTVCAAGIASTWCSANTSTRDATSFLRAPILTVNGTSGNFADLKWEPTGGGGDGIFQVTGQFGTQQNWTNGIAVSFDNAQTWTLRSADALTAPAVVAGCDAEGMLPIARIKCQKQKEAEAEGYASIADKRRAEAAEGYRPNERAAKVEFVDGSVVRTDGQILIPGNAADLKAWALDPNSSGDDQIILLIVVSIAARQAKESFGLDERVSSVIYTVIKALSVAWVSLYWLPDVAEKLGLDV
jgi:hypothetical protein